MTSKFHYGVFIFRYLVSMPLITQPIYGCVSDHGPLARYVKLRVRMRREYRERFPRHRK